MADQQTSVMVLDDDPIVLTSLCEYLQLEGYKVSSASSLQAAMSLLERDRFNVVLTDVRLPEGTGFDLLEHIRGLNVPTSVIMLTGYGTIEDAVRAIKTGAFDYVTKPISDDEVRLAIERACQQQELLAENNRLRQQLNMTFRLDNFVCSDPRMKRVLEMVRTVSGTGATVLITGESGTGKTMVARVIHMNSARAGKPFIEVSCGALPDTLLESELFGHVKGAFSGAVSNKRGRFDAADKGTLFLDEISLATPPLQVKLLRVLESLQFEPVGSNETREVDVRLILATNQDLTELVEEGAFREDLYYRINVLHIDLPPLRDRKQDIPALANYFLEKYRGLALHPVEAISEDAMRLLLDYTWPGNVRELENVMQRSVVLCRGKELTPEDFSIQGDHTQASPLAVNDEVGPLRERMKKVEREIILRTLEACDGNRKESARTLGINRTTLYNKLHEHDLMDK